MQRVSPGFGLGSRRAERRGSGDYHCGDFSGSRINLPSTIIEQIGEGSQWNSARASARLFLPHPTKTAKDGAASVFMLPAKTQRGKAGPARLVENGIAGIRFIS